MSENDIIKEVIENAPNRRSFVAKIGLASAVLGAASVTKIAKAQSQSTITDADILNFALNLEYLEAEFYTVATTGSTIDNYGLAISGSGTSGPTTGGGQVSFGTGDTTLQRIAEELAADERTHVSLLQGAITGLGGTPIAKPAINLNALGFGFGSVGDFIKLARIFEDIGVTAYGGAAPLITDKTILGYAARILATEAEHVGNIRLLHYLYGIQSMPLDGVDIVPPPSGPKFFSTNGMAITQIRTPGQVLFLAFGGQASATSGGFFPSGVNGTLNTSDTASATETGATLTATPNPIPVAPGQLGVTTISWSAPNSTIIQVRVGSPDGPLFTDNFSTGSMATGQWVTDGLVFYLQDVTNGQALTAANTLATLIVYLQPSS